MVFLQQQIQVLVDTESDLVYNPYLLSMSRQRKVLLTICIDSSTSKYLLPRWWNGRHGGLRSHCQKRESSSLSWGTMIYKEYNV